ncbi:transporter substrate-binding domain-containing protein [Nesterenkonia pannonica]|uniref:transporter substrate-binding domain-containing protein n=1 Tax=Nesterenkonia pannonica TaxID=1548602 RepID=UPI0021643ACE|nr:transporter substrate-binding domain-containing protein [Nesterenkonia pannonica]
MLGERPGRPEFIGLEDTNSTILALNSDRADYAGTTQAAALDIQGQSPDEYGYIAQSDEQGVSTDLLAMFLPRDNDLAEPMYEAFQAIFENGEYERVMEDWNLQDASVDEPSLNPMSDDDS